MQTKRIRWSWVWWAKLAYLFWQYAIDWECAVGLGAITAYGWLMSAAMASPTPAQPDSYSLTSDSRPVM